MGEGATKIKQVQTRERGMGGEGGSKFWDILSESNN